jgi:hypothetical protein
MCGLVAGHADHGSTPLEPVEPEHTLARAQYLPHEPGGELNGTEMTAITVVPSAARLRPARAETAPVKGHQPPLPAVGSCELVESVERS